MSINSKAKCAENDYLYNKLLELKIHQSRKGEDRRAVNTKRVLTALQVFPLPVLSGKMSEDLLQGVGSWFATTIDKILKSRPEKRRKSSSPAVTTKFPKLDIPPTPLTIPSPSVNFHPDEWLTMIPPITIPPLTIPPSTIPPLTIPPSTIPPLAIPPLTIPPLTIPPSTIPTLTIPTLTIPLLTIPTLTVPISPTSTIDFTIILQVDSAERLSNDFCVISQRLLNRGILIEKKKLWIGDYQWVCRMGAAEFHLGLVVERKTAEDLTASIIDGRYESQKFRLKQAKVRCIYLLEGKKTVNSGRITHDTLMFALINTCLTCDFQLKLSRGTQETLNWLTRMTSGLFRKLTTWPLSNFLNLTPIAEFQASTCPQKNLTVQETFGKQLRSLTKFGEQCTLSVLKTYPCPYPLYAALKAASLKGKRAQNAFFKQFRLSNGNSLPKPQKQQLRALFLGNGC